jgi:hypothetical protein
MGKAVTRPVAKRSRALSQTAADMSGGSTPHVATELWTHAETAAFLRISPRTLHYINGKGCGPRSYKIGKYRRYDPADLQRWLDIRASEGEPWLT